MVDGSAVGLVRTLGQSVSRLPLRSSRRRPAMSPTHLDNIRQYDRLRMLMRAYRNGRHVCPDCARLSLGAASGARRHPPSGRGFFRCGLAAASEPEGEGG